MFSIVTLSSLDNRWEETDGRGYALTRTQGLGKNRDLCRLHRTEKDGQPFALRPAHSHILPNILQR